MRCACLFALNKPFLIGERQMPPLGSSGMCPDANWMRRQSCSSSAAKLKSSSATAYGAVATPLATPHIGLKMKPQRAHRVQQQEFKARHRNARSDPPADLGLVNIGADRHVPAINIQSRGRLEQGGPPPSSRTAATIALTELPQPSGDTAGTILSTATAEEVMKRRGKARGQGGTANVSQTVVADAAPQIDRAK